VVNGSNSIPINDASRKDELPHPHLPIRESPRIGLLATGQEKVASPIRQNIFLSGAASAINLSFNYWKILFFSCGIQPNNRIGGWRGTDIFKLYNSV
jgi:hypothetical protein